MPKLLVTDARSCIDAAVRRIEDGAQLPGVSQEQALQLVIIVHAKQHGHRFAIPRDYHRSRGTRLQVRAQPGFHVGHRSNLHSFTSSPPTNKRFLSLTPMAKTRTCRSSASTR